MAGRESTGIPFAGCFGAGPAMEAARIVFVGLPDDSKSTFLRGPAEGPDRIRSAYDGRCYNPACESGADLEGRVADLGDIPSGDTWAETRVGYANCVRQLLSEGRTPFFAGGDHAVTVPLVEGLDVLKEAVHVVQLDAHPDLYDSFEDDPASHACVAARILEMEHVASLTQIGVRTLNAAQGPVAERHRGRLRIFGAREVGTDAVELRHLPSDALVYVTLDMDVFDPGFAPGVSHPVPGGLAPRQALDFLQNGAWRLAAMDVVETNPARDFNDCTAVLAARLLHEGMGRALLERAAQDGIE